MSRKTVHKWKRRYDGTVESLKNRSRAPLHSPLKQSDWEIQLVQRYAKKYPRDLLLGYEKAQKSGYVRCASNYIDKENGSRHQKE